MNASRPLRARTPRGDLAYTWFAIGLVALAFLVLGLTVGLAHAHDRSLPPNPTAAPAGANTADASTDRSTNGQGVKP